MIRESALETDSKNNNKTITRNITKSADECIRIFNIQYKENYDKGIDILLTYCSWQLFSINREKIRNKEKSNLRINDAKSNVKQERYYKYIRRYLILQWLSD